MQGEVRHWYAEMRYSFLVNLMQKLLKSVNICNSCCNKFTATFFMPHSVYVCVCELLSASLYFSKRGAY